MITPSIYIATPTLLRLLLVLETMNKTIDGIYHLYNDDEEMTRQDETISEANWYL
jgi:hypothetical protein